MSTFCLTGGLCECEYIREALSKELGKEVISCPDARYAGAIGAALSAANKKCPGTDFKINLSRGNLYSFTYILLSQTFLFVYYLILKIGLIFL